MQEIRVKVTWWDNHVKAVRVEETILLDQSKKVAVDGVVLQANYFDFAVEGLFVFEDEEGPWMVEAKDILEMEFLED